MTILFIIYFLFSHEPPQVGTECSQSLMQFLTDRATVKTTFRIVDTTLTRNNKIEIYNWLVLNFYCQSTRNVIS